MRDLNSTDTHSSRLSEDADLCMEVEGHKPLIPEGKYLARYLGHETAVLFAKAHKVALSFEICEGPHSGTRLTRYFRVKQVVGKAGRGGRFKLAAGGDLYRTLARVLDVRTRPDRISLRPLQTILLQIGVRTVSKDRDNLPLAEGVQYSVIDTLEDGR
jgi:hypothetical protein